MSLPADADDLEPDTTPEGPGDFEQAPRREGPEIPAGLTIAEILAHAARTPAAPPPEDDLFDARPTLRHLRDYARARRVAPAAVLAAACVRALATVPPCVKLPALVGSEASLNLFAALVGPPGAGKGGAEGVAAEAITFHGILIDDNMSAPHQVRTLPIGTGEGIARAFTPEEDEDPTVKETAIFIAPEVDTLAALLGRQGATLGGVVRSGFMGEQLGFTNAQKATTTNVPAHTYRMGLIVGVQPLRAAVLLDGADGGTPQRFWWASVTDPWAPDIAPDQPEPMSVAIPDWEPGHLEVPSAARAEVDAHRLGVLREDAGIDPLDGHRLLLRLKIAAALAILESRQKITDDDWKLARRVQNHSDRVRAGVVAATDEAARKRAAARAIATDEAEQIIADRRHARARAHLERRLRGQGEQRHTAMVEAAKADIRKSIGPAAVELSDEGLIKIREEIGGNHQTATYYLWIGD
ncbi:hypothetical protein [Nocardia sp. IFM 10818]